MDINVIRGLLTAVMLLLFVILCGWLWLARSKADFDDAASLPLRDGEVDGQNGGKHGGKPDGQLRDKTNTANEAKS